MKTNTLVPTNIKTPPSKSELSKLEEQLKALRLKRRTLKKQAYAMSQTMTWQQMIDAPEWLDCQASVYQLTDSIHELSTRLNKLRSHGGEIYTDRVELGCQVTLGDDNGRTVNYQLVDSFEADPAKGLISDESPLGQKILGRRLYDIVSLDNLKHHLSRTYRIMSIA